MPRIHRLKQPTPTPSEVNPQVALAESIAQRCVQAKQYLSPVQFKRQVLGHAENDTRNVHAHFSKFLNQLSAEDRQRIVKAQAQAMGKAVIEPDAVRERVRELKLICAPDAGGTGI